MKSIMRGQERRRRRRVIVTVCVIAVPVLTAGAWLLFFSGGDQAAGAFQPVVSPSEAQTFAEAPLKSALGVSTAVPTATIDPNDWRLILVNAQHSLPEGFKVSLTELKNGQSVDERCYPDIQQMMDDCRAEGYKPLICSSYRSQEKQQDLFDKKAAKLAAQGLSDEEARAKAATVVALPGTSEHQTGLAVDIVDIENQNLDDSQKDMPIQLWLKENCRKYGFILRYTAEKTDITGIVYEPWHYRYVGREAAKVICENSLCLEEYLNQPG